MTFFTVAWIVAAALIGSTLSISASPDSSLVDSGTSNAIQNPRKAPMVNKSDVFHSAGLSEVEILQRIGKFNRRSKRDSATEAVLLNAISGLNILGIAVSAVEPISGSCLLILATLLQLCFPGNEDPVKQIQDIVWNERVKQQKLKLISIRNIMNEIKRQYETTNDISIPHRRQLTLYDYLSLQQCLFMHDDNIEASADYFSEFAFIHIAVNQALILIHPNESIFQESLIQTVKTYVAYAKHAQQIETQNNLNREYRPRSTRVRSLLDPHIQKWTKQLPAHLQAEVNEQGWIRNGEMVSFQMSYRPGSWLSCWGSGSECKLRNCPGRDNPMERGSQYDYHWKCRGEIFWIYPINDSDRFIKSCTKVGIWYSFMSDKYWWLSMYCEGWGFVCKTYTTSCTGFNTTKMRQGNCSPEVWTITAKDKRCGEAIQDRDVVLLGHSSNTSEICLFSSDFTFHNGRIRADFGVFTIFRSNVDHGEYKKDEVCRG